MFESHISKSRSQIVEIYGQEKNSTFLVKMKIQIIINHDHQILYSKNGTTFRIDQLDNDQKQYELLTNLDQIKTFQLVGDFGQDKRKCGRWQGIWDGIALCEVAGYYEKGVKQGIWNQLFKNYQSNNIIYECGEYSKNQKIERWKYIFENNEIGGGLYSEGCDQEKIGKWIELDDGFHNFKKVRYSGEYKNGKKIGIWEIWHDKNIKNKEAIIIGGGSYDELGQGIKIGKWFEISDAFNDESQVTYVGEYKNGAKVKRWDIKNQNEIIGGGLYNENGDQSKIGEWIEISDKYSNKLQITYKGQYNYGNKTGRWDIKNKDKQIGGGLYDEAGQGVKIGQWIDICDEFYSWSKISYNGEYNNGQKVGRWNIMYENQQIGGGLYDEASKGSKIGQWIDICDEFYSWSKISYNGEYNNGQKFGRWNIMYENKQIGGGLYDEACQGIKIGKWVEISDGFTNQSQVTYNGVYNNEKKVGRWEIKDKKKIMQFYLFIKKTKSNFLVVVDSMMKKAKELKMGNGLILGMDILINLKLHIMVLIYSVKRLVNGIPYYIGMGINRLVVDHMIKQEKKLKLVNGLIQPMDFIMILKQFMKVNTIMVKKLVNGLLSLEVIMNFPFNGGGLYEQDKGMKIGEWVEISDGFYSDSQVFYKGQFQSGNKSGVWEIWFQDERNNKKKIKIGGGLYGKGIKIGQWIEISDEFYSDFLVVSKGQYINGKKVGMWKEMNIENQKVTKEIQYDE
ncbi:unnamed protein product [Paramecium octaurelia]|uniref:Uncharacterized protein n=1 Tax=Paramecium octaurelia TaxID=43137 RepID=A0A8S1W0K6_PAROT|nr:unnamed protein product [Paramecium octaurelia]